MDSGPGPACNRASSRVGLRDASLAACDGRRDGVMLERKAGRASRWVTASRSCTVSDDDCCTGALKSMDGCTSRMSLLSFGARQEPAGAGTALERGLSTTKSPDFWFLNNAQSVARRSFLCCSCVSPQSKGAARCRSPKFMHVVAAPCTAVKTRQELQLASTTSTL